MNALAQPIPAKERFLDSFQKMAREGNVPVSEWLEKSLYPNEDHLSELTAMPLAAVLRSTPNKSAA